MYDLLCSTILCAVGCLVIGVLYVVGWTLRAVLCAVLRSVQLRCVMRAVLQWSDVLCFALGCVLCALLLRAVRYAALPCVVLHCHATSALCSVLSVVLHAADLPRVYSALFCNTRKTMEGKPNRGHPCFRPRAKNNSESQNICRNNLDFESGGPVACLYSRFVKFAVG